jgi:hypoxanthine-guanine phosphoribosyltransferase
LTGRAGCTGRIIVVGFGLDFNQLYRDLHYVAVLKREKG